MNKGPAKTIADLRAIVDDLERAEKAIENAGSTKELAELDYRRLIISKGLQLGAQTVGIEIGKKVLSRRAQLRHR